MSDDERVLRSFVVEDEELQDLYTITTAKHSKGQLPPAGGEETVAVTDERVLWFSNELQDVSFDVIEETDLEYVERQAAPPVVLGGGLLFVVGIFASIGAFFAGVESLLVVAMPAMTGLAAFMGTRIFADVTGREGQTRAGHRLRLWTEDGPVSLWGDDERTMKRIRAAVRGEEVDVGDPTVDDMFDEESDATVQSTTATEVSRDAGTARPSDDETGG